MENITFTISEGSLIRTALITRERHIAELLHRWEKGIAANPDDTVTLDLIQMYKAEQASIQALHEKFNN